MVQGCAQVKRTVGKGFGIRNTGLLGIPRHRVDVPGMVLIIGRRGKVYTGPE